MIRSLSTLALVLTLAACGGGGGDNNGRLKLAVTDAPVDDATKVVVRFTGIELQGAGGEQLQFDFEPREIDLLALTGTDSELLFDGDGDGEGDTEGFELPAGNYQGLRLKVLTSRDTLDSYIELEDGSQHPLFVPSGAESGLKLNRSFTVAAGGTADFTVDFDLRKSVHEPQNPNDDAYFLRPTLRIVDNTVVGVIVGEVATSLITPNCTPAIYAYAGAGVIPDDIDGAAPEPLTTATVRAPDAQSTTYRYTIGFLEPGAYTLAFTCDAAADDPTVSDTIVFGEPKPANVTADTTTTVNF